MISIEGRAGHACFAAASCSAFASASRTWRCASAVDSAVMTFCTGLQGQGATLLVTLPLLPTGHKRAGTCSRTFAQSLDRPKGDQSSRRSGWKLLHRSVSEMDDFQQVRMFKSKQAFTLQRVVQQRAADDAPP